MSDSPPPQPADIQHIDELDYKQVQHDADLVEFAVVPPAASQPPPSTPPLLTSHTQSNSSSHLLHSASTTPTSHSSTPQFASPPATPLPTHLEPSFDALDNTDAQQKQNEQGGVNGNGTQHKAKTEPVSLRQPLHHSTVAREIAQLRPLLTSSVRSASIAVTSFSRNSLLSLVSYVRSSPSNLRTSAVGFYHKPSQLRLEILLGVSLSALLVVDGIAFALTAGALPIIGLYACFILTLCTSVFGGCPGMVSGAAGSTAAVQAAITSESGSFSHLSADGRLQALFFCLFLSGVCEVLVGWLGLAQLAILIPYTVMVGFMNGLSIIIFISQLQAFQYCPTSSTFTDCTVSQRRWLSADELTTWLTVIHALLAMLIMRYAHTIPVRFIRWIPPVLLAAVIGSAVEHGIFRAGINHPTRTVKETAAISGSLPSVAFPSTSALSSSDAGQIVLQSVLVAFVGLVESILTLNALNVKKHVRTVPSDFNTESIAQGVGNIACSLTGALGGCALVGESSLNIDAGSRSRLSTFVSAWCICIYITALYSVINLLPIATVTGVMFTIVLNLFQWRTTATALLRLRVSDAIIIYAVTAISVAVDLAIGVAVGIVLHALVFAYDMGKRPQFIVGIKWDATRVSEPKAAGSEDAAVNLNGGSADVLCTVAVHGVLYFGSVEAFVSGCHPDVLLAQSTTQAAAAGAGEVGTVTEVVSVVLNMRHCRLLDFSASCALDDVVNEWRKRGWSVEVSGVDEQQRMRLSLAQALTPSKQTLTWRDEYERTAPVDTKQH